MARGINAARKLRTVRRVQRWSDYRYKKFASPDTDRKSPFGGASHASGHVVKRDMLVSAKQPNSGLRKCVQVILTKNQKKVIAFCPRDGSINYIDLNDEVLLSGLGRSGHSVGDIPGCRFKVVRVASASIMALFRGKKEKRRF